MFTVIMQRAVLLSMAVGAGLSMAGGSAYAQEKTVVIHGTATPGGGFPVYGDAFAATINETDATLSVQPKNTKGSTENVPLLEAGSLDTGQVTGEVTYEAVAGIGRAPANLKILSAMYSNTGMFIVRADSPHKSIADLKGKPIAWGASGSGFVVLARYAMDGVGLDLNHGRIKNRDTLATRPIVAAFVKRQFDTICVYFLYLHLVGLNINPIGYGEQMPLS